MTARSKRPSGPVLRAVRAATARLHDALDADADGQKILAGEVQRDTYARMLLAHRALHDFVSGHTHACLEQRPTQTLLDWPDCARIGALHSDLERLGVVSSVEASTPAASPNHAFACGLLYVVEGACHGTGQMLRSLRKNPRFVAWRADAFMVASRAGIGTRWPQTVALLEGCGEAQLGDVTAGAVAGFEHYAQAYANTSAVPA